MIKGRFLASFVVIGLVAALMAGATYAVFTSTASNDGNVFATGTVNVTAGVTTFGGAVANMAPGDVVTGEFVVTNTGSLELKYTITPSATGVLFEGTAPAVLAIVTGEDQGMLAAGASATVHYSVSFPSGAGNEYQDAAGNIVFTVDAQQTANNP